MLKHPLKIISVTGAHSNVGKTTLCSILLKKLKGFGAIKFTKNDARCKSESTRTGMQDAEYKIKETLQTKDQRLQTNPPLLPFSKGGRGGIIEDIGILRQKDKDTAIFLESGAREVIWIKSPYNKLEKFLHAAIDRMTGLKGVIVEGNSPVDFLNPGLIIFVIGSNGEIKPSAVKVSKKAGIVVINSGKRDEDRPFLSAFRREGCKVFWIDLGKRKGEINEFLSFVKQRINKSPH